MTDEDIKILGDSILSRGLRVPAVFFLELHKPVAHLVGEGISASKPLLSLLFKSANLETARQLCSSPDQIEQLITYLEHA